MTPKEKALELWEKYFRLNYDWDGATKDGWAKEGALIAVDEILNTHLLSEKDIFGIHPVDYWSQVKQEIEAL
jgi:hypothetical protein